MKRGAAVAVIVACARVAYGDPAPADPAATAAAQEANLESTAPRSGHTFALAIGPGLIEADGKNARAPAFSFRFGHVATPTTILCLEVTGETFVTPAGAKSSLSDSEGSVLISAQYYFAQQLWTRIGGGLTTNTNKGLDGSQAVRSGPGGVFAVGIDLVRWHTNVLGLESFFTASINSSGGAALGGLLLGLSRY